MLPSIILFPSNLLIDIPTSKTPPWLQIAECISASVHGRDIRTAGIEWILVISLMSVSNFKRSLQWHPLFNYKLSKILSLFNVYCWLSGLTLWPLTNASQVRYGIGMFDSHQIRQVGFVLSNLSFCPQWEHRNNSVCANVIAWYFNKLKNVIYKLSLKIFCCRSNQSEFRYGVISHRDGNMSFIFKL